MRGVPLTEQQRAMALQMRAEGYTCVTTAAAVGVSEWAVRNIAPGHYAKVPNDRLREAFVRSGVSASTVARRLGWECPRRGRPFPDTSRVKRTLGLLPTVGNGYTQVRKMIDWETASLIADAIGVGAWEVLDDVVAA